VSKWRIKLRAVLRPIREGPTMFRQRALYSCFQWDIYLFLLSLTNFTCSFCLTLIKLWWLGHSQCVIFRHLYLHYLHLHLVPVMFQGRCSPSFPCWLQSTAHSIQSYMCSSQTNSKWPSGIFGEDLATWSSAISHVALEIHAWNPLN